MTPSEVADHYQSFPARETILAALTRRGIDPLYLVPDQLAPFDQLHTGGAEATAALIARLSPRAGDHVLDVGSGLGGPARMLADRTGARVTGVDLTPRFVADAAFFSACTGQAGEAAFQEASATALPFGDRTFDGAWQIHVAMNVADKAAMYREIFRVLKPGARFAIDDPVRGEGEMLFPVPWAVTSADSHLVSADALVAYLTAAGFADVDMRDITAGGIDWFAEVERMRKGGRTPSPLEVMTANHRANLISGAVRIVSIVAKRPLL